MKKFGGLTSINQYIFEALKYLKENNLYQRQQNYFTRNRSVILPKLRLTTNIKSFAFQSVKLEWQNFQNKQFLEIVETFLKGNVFYEMYALYS